MANALQPAKVKEVHVDPETGTAQVTVPDYQLSLAIGKEGQNARLAAKLTGFRIDIKSETQAADERRPRERPAPAQDAVLTGASEAPEMEVDGSVPGAPEERVVVEDAAVVEPEAPASA